MKGAAPFSLRPPYRVGWYIDGFNLYHALAALDEPGVKWLDLWSLARSYLRDDQVIERVLYSTAVNTWDPGKRSRHMEYIKALQHQGVDVREARFDKTRKFCRKNEVYCVFREEKQSDVNLAVNALCDLYEKKVDTAFFLTADSDQVPTFRAIIEKFPDARLNLLAPPGRLEQARELAALAHNKFELTAGRIKQHLLPEVISRDDGGVIARRPIEYAAD